MLIGHDSGRTTDLEFLLEFVEDVERVAPFAVELVYEDYHRGAAHAAHLHQAARLSLDALCHVDHDYHRVHGRECAEGVFGKVLVAGGVEDVYLVIAVVEPHYGGGHRYAALLLDVHPVGSGGFFILLLSRPRPHGLRHRKEGASR